MFLAVLGLFMFALLMLAGGRRGQGGLDFRPALEDKSSAWRLLFGWPAVKAIVLGALGWLLISRLVDSETAWGALGLAVGGWVVAAVLLAAFDASPRE